MKDAKGHGSNSKGASEAAAHQSMVRKVLASGNFGSALSHSITGFDRKQQARADATGGYHNQNFLGIALGRVDDTAKAVKNGTSTADAINQNFNGALARHLHKQLGTGGTDVDTQRKKLFDE